MGTTLQKVKQFEVDNFMENLINFSLASALMARINRQNEPLKKVKIKRSAPVSQHRNHRNSFYKILKNGRSKNLLLKETLERRIGLGLQRICEKIKIHFKTFG